MSQKSILNYFSPATGSKGKANENSPGQRGGGDNVRDDVTPVKKSRIVSGSKRGNKWINPLKDDDSVKKQKLAIGSNKIGDNGNMDEEDHYCKGKTTPRSSSKLPTVVPSLVDISFDDNDDPQPSTSLGVASSSKTVSTPKSTSLVTRTTKSTSTPKSVTKMRFGRTPLSALVSKDDGFSNESDAASWPPKGSEYDFLRPKNIRDKNRKRPDDPDYDEKTLYVPPGFLDKQTDTKKQWWTIKSEMYDTVLAFKVGKFYELFNMDAMIGIKHLNLLPMGNSHYHSGFPEVSFPKYTDILRERGFMISRIEQTESNEARNRRLKNKNKSVKCVNRETCRIITPGVSLLNDFDAESCNKHSNKSNYLMAVCQKAQDSEDRTPEFGVCFVDSAIGKVFVAQFKDDLQCSRLRTLIAHHPPAEVLVEKKFKNLCSLAVNIFEKQLAYVLKQHLKPETEFLSSSNTMKKIREEKYFENDDGTNNFPDILKKMLDSGSNNPSVLPEFELAFRSLGAIIWNLSRCLVDEDILTLKNFECYVPPDCDVALDIDSVRLPSHLIMDSVTLDNLDVIGRSAQDKRGSLFGLLNNCFTNFGERQLRSMVYTPSCDIEVINDRLDAIEDIENCLKKNGKMFDFFKKMPDLEKILSKLHSESINRKKDHPDSRAQMFSDVDTRKVRNFLELLESLAKIGDALKSLNCHSSVFKSSLLKKSLAPESEGGNVPDLRTIVSNFKQTFDVIEAKESGRIIPEKGSDPDYDQCYNKIKRIEKRLEDIRKRECEFFKSSDIEFVDQGKKRYLLKIPEKVFNRVNPPARYQFEGSVKGFKRMSTIEIQDIVTELKEAEEGQDVVMTKIRRNLFARFRKNNPKFFPVIKCLALLDALLSLTKAKLFLGRYSTLCRPTFVQPTGDQLPFISIRDGRNPILSQIVDDYIPNDIDLSNKLIILTGPNMGGKSTLMRSVGLIAIMAQIGSYVPAKSVIMTPIDRIFTRLGAADNIVGGQSTFMVELNQTCTIVKHATRNSLILLDELGRGTATHDGTAIAYSVVDHVASQIKCRTLFSTHYHSLVEEFENNTSVVSNHMSCLVEEKNGKEKIVFLYKLTDGDCPKSYGFHAARLANLPDEIVSVAEEKATETENQFQLRRKMCKLLKTKFLAGNEAKLLLQRLKTLIS